MPNSFKLRLKKLPLPKKLVLVGSALTVIGVFLPWYADIDKFNIGDRFFGITGPLYLAGFIVLVAAVASFSVILMKLLNKPVPKLPLKENHLHIFASVLCGLMLVLTSSVYFHPKFGINLTDKSVGVGMILAFIGSGIVLLGGLLGMKKRDVSFEDDGHIEPLIDMTEREKSDVSMRNDIDVRNDVKSDPGINRESTIGDAVTAQNLGREIPAPPTEVWGPVQESINNYKTETDTNDIK